MDEKATFLQREFGIKAGLPRFTWKCIQKTKNTAKTPDRASSAMLAALWILDKDPVKTL